MNFIAFMNEFPDDKTIIKHFIKIRYGNEVKCNHCGSTKVYQRTNTPKVFDCGACKNTFSVFTGTIFEKSDTDLRKWFYAIHLFLNSKKGISGYQLKREISVTYKTAWRMLKQIRTAMGNKENQEFFDTIIEIDETYVGGKPRKENKKSSDSKDKPKNKRGRGTKKTPVVGIIDRDKKKIHAKVMLPNRNGKKLTGFQLINLIKQVAKESNKTVVMTDEFSGYNRLDRSKFIHLKVNHQERYSDGLIHVNNMESFWAVFKRGIYGIYHHVSIKYMQKYVDEFCFRYDNRDLNMFDLVLKQAVL